MVRVNFCAPDTRQSSDFRPANGDLDTAPTGSVPAAAGPQPGQTSPPAL